MKLFLQDVQNLNTIIHLPDCFCGIHYSTFRHHYSDCLQCQTHIEPSSIWCIKDTTVSSVLEFYVQLYNNHAVRWYIIKCEKTPPSFIKTEKNGLLFFIKSESFCNRLRYRCRHRTTTRCRFKNKMLSFALHVDMEVASITVKKNHITRVSCFLRYSLPSFPEWSTKETILLFTFTSTFESFTSNQWSIKTNKSV